MEEQKPNKKINKADDPTKHRNKEVHSNESLTSKIRTAKNRAHCSSTESSSHSKFYIKNKYGKNFKQITRDQYNNISESISSTDTYQCIHGPGGKVYTKDGLLKRAFLKELDPIVIAPELTDNCPLSRDWEIASTLETIINDSLALLQLERFELELRELARLSSKGYRVDILDSVVVIISFLLNTVEQVPSLEETLLVLLKNMKNPILLTSAADYVKYFKLIRNFIGYMGYLMMKVEDDNKFNLVCNAILWQLTAPDPIRGPGSASIRHILAAAPVLIEPTSKMLSIAPLRKFGPFLEIALILALDSADNCIEFMRENIIEVIFYRFNPYFPEPSLPWYNVNPADCNDMNLKLGASSIHISTTLSLLLVLSKTTREFLAAHPQYRAILPCPHYESQRCFIWAYRYECRAREHHHERITLTTIAAALLKCFGSKLMAFSSSLMPDIMSLSVFTELPLRKDWIGTVNFNTMQQDVLFKKILINFVVDLLKTFPYNKFMVKSRYWLLGMMYLLDPGLSQLRAHWSPAHFGEIRKIALQALVVCLPLCDYELVQEYAIIRRILWYIEWYTESPYEIQILYWCVRLLFVAVSYRNTIYREQSLTDLFDTHGIIILIRLCYILLEYKTADQKNVDQKNASLKKIPPVERSQAILSVCLRLLTSAAHRNVQQFVSCCVYPSITWPGAIVGVAKHMLNVVLLAFDNSYIISDRWLISLLNFIWEGIIWKTKYREVFVATDGVYKLLDIITVTRPAVQCITLAMICDIMRAGDGVGQLVTWRANIAASNANPVLVKRGDTIATLIAAIFRDECQKSNIPLNVHGILRELNHPIMSPRIRTALGTHNLRHTKSPRTPVSLSLGEIAGSRMPKVFAILHMLSEDLKRKVEIADEAYNLYKNIKLEAKDETVLVLCWHYLTLKLNEVWTENLIQVSELVHKDKIILDEFLHIGEGWAKEIKRQQEDIMTRDQKKKYEEEKSLYAFLGRIQLNTALEALNEIRCVARSADRHLITNDMINDAVFAHHRLAAFAQRIDAPVLRTYRPALDDYNITGMKAKIISIKATADLAGYSKSTDTGTT